MKLHCCKPSLTPWSLEELKMWHDMIVTDCVSMCFLYISSWHFLNFPEISVISVEDLRERSAEVWAQCRALATELGEAEAALARRQAEECLGELPPWTLDNSGFWRLEKELEFKYV